jgi:hypothetical protein
MTAIGQLIFKALAGSWHEISVRNGRKNDAKSRSKKRNKSAT